ncbi:isopentenyl-diphosphate Delta-isomerase [Nocardia seriolae]|nr:isopentenyl-diphosphate Delta-isomerase [Nocardia seriolae]MTJ76502.1 isopentenyl-diphosphate Delta-isomerase [Nocardia seriolae]MTJ89318.1 isopentenyl-diphosphate Delta-isomerase [Nocardia seriolae]MTK33295.1 isopentenyl-diphosphate Delta-isomerase [Nocardia seriolae]MTK40508.1 isopentenyl-diphosphate Delta-isomerase [Nocardia seriolae]
MLVELVDERGHARGSLSVAAAHTAPGRLHRAFSVLLFDADGRVLLQQRAGVKTRFPLLWTNTCCGHPEPGQAVVEAAAKRLHEELGISAELSEVGVFTYQATDPNTGRVEFEYDHVLIGLLEDTAPQPNPDEVADIAWIRPDTLADHVATTPQRYTPWLAGVLTTIAAARP